MKRLFLTTAASAVVLGLGTLGAVAASIAPYPPGTIVYGELRGTPPADFPPPATAAPIGFHYEWVYGYDQHAVYRGHWEAVRNS